MMMCKKKKVWFLGCLFQYCTIFPTVNHLLKRGMRSLEAHTLTIYSTKSQTNHNTAIDLCTNLKV